MLIKTPQSSSKTSKNGGDFPPQALKNGGGIKLIKMNVISYPHIVYYILNTLVQSHMTLQNHVIS